MTSIKQTQLFPVEDDGRQDYTATFADNMSLPVHRWFRYTAGFSAAWVQELIQEEIKKGRSRVIDPFAGSGTVLLESDMAQVESIGIEAHPYIYRIAKTKICWNFPPELFRDAALSLLKKAQGKKITTVNYPKLLQSCYPLEILHRLDALKQTWLEIPQSAETKDFTWFLITCILRITSPVGTAQWQYILPNKSKSKVVDPFMAYEVKVYEMYADMRRLQSRITSGSLARVFQEDARAQTSIPDGWGDLVITSPPYANNYDYADATRLEMTFWGDIDNWGDLQTTVRQHLVRACTQHVSGMGSNAMELLAAPQLNPIRDELTNIFSRLEAERFNHGGNIG
ncbi:MAG: DNA methyltransferase [Saprospiraceae bacterium]